MNADALKIPLTPRTIAIAALMTHGAAAAHELLHHIVGAMMCRPGRMSLELFVGAEGCAPSIAISAIGPLLNYFLLWIGAGLMYARRHALLGAGLVVASLPLIRYVGIAMGGNDEGVIARMLLDPPLARWAAPAVCGVLLLPPAIYAGVALAQPGRWWRWALMISGPLLLLMPMRWIDHRLFADWMRDGATMVPNASDGAVHSRGSGRPVIAADPERTAGAGQ